MRQIKFRAWDGKDMRLPEYSDKEDFHLLPDGTVVFTYEVGYERHEQTGRRGDQWVVMQYTGLKDKNGKEIYEGDKVRILYTDWPSNSDPTISLDDYRKSISKLGEVIYEAPEWCLQIKGYTDSILPGTHGEIEVIGNIYEPTVTN